MKILKLISLVTLLTTLSACSTVGNWMGYDETRTDSTLTPKLNLKDVKDSEKVVYLEINNETTQTLEGFDKALIKKLNNNHWRVVTDKDQAFYFVQLDIKSIRKANSEESKLGDILISNKTYHSFSNIKLLSKVDMPESTILRANLGIENPKITQYTQKDDWDTQNTKLTTSAYKVDLTLNEALPEIENEMINNIINILQNAVPDTGFDFL